MVMAAVADAVPTPCLHDFQDRRRARELFRYVTSTDLAVAASTSLLADCDSSSLHTILQPYCELVALRCNAKKAMLNLMDASTMYFLASAAINRSDPDDLCGRDPILTACSDAVPLRGRLCELTIRMTSNGSTSPMFTVTNLTESTFKNLSVVKGPPHFRFYAGTPITTRAGINIGSLAVLDYEPREAGLTESQEAFLGQTASQVMVLLESVRRTFEGKRATRMAASLQAFITGRPTKTRLSPSAATTPTFNKHDGRSISTNDDLHRKSPQRAFIGTSDTGGDRNFHQGRFGEIRESGSHYPIYKRATGHMREAFGDLGEHGMITFITLDRRMNSDPNMASAINVVAARSGRDLVGEERAVFQPDQLTGQCLERLIRRYAHGRHFILDDSDQATSSDDEDLTSIAVPSNKQSDPPHSMLRRAFPYARQGLFMPLWNSDKSASESAAFITTSDPQHSLFDSINLCFLNSFCCSIMAECSRFDALQSAKQKSDFASTVSHELRSPLHGILASLDFMESTSLNNYQRVLLDTVQGCGRTLLDTINHVLDFSKINTFKKNWQASNTRTQGLARGISAGSSDYQTHLSLTMETTHIATVVEEVVDTVVVSQLLTSGLGLLETPPLGQDPSWSTTRASSICDSSPVKIILDIQRADWTFTTQPGAIRRILQNLLGNALKYTANGSVTIHLRQEHGPGGQDLVVLSVTDTGKGIGQHFLDTKLFSAFAQEDVSVAGLGLGLSIVRSLGTMLGGTATVRSDLGQGTTAEVILPMDRPIVQDHDANNTSGSTKDLPIPDLHIQLLRSQSRDFRISILLSSDQITKQVSEYVCGWYGFEIVSAAADIVIIDEVNLQYCDSTSRAYPALVQVYDIKRHKVRDAVHESGSPIAIVSQPLGPYKLAASLCNVIKRLEKTSPPARPGSVSPALLQRSSLATSRYLGSLYGLSRSHKQASEEPAGMGSSGSAGNSGIFTTSSTTSLGSFPFPKQSEHIESASVTEKSEPHASSPPAPSQYDHQKSDEAVLTVSLTATPTDSLSHFTALPQKRRHPRVLVVDDNKVNIDLLTFFLRRKRKYTDVDSAENGQIALEKFKAREHGYDIIFMDISMPIMTGFEATRAIRKHESATKDVLIVAFTGLASEADQREAFQSGVDLYFTKPVPFKAVGDVLNDWEMLRPNYLETFDSDVAASR